MGKNTLASVKTVLRPFMIGASGVPLHIALSPCRGTFSAQPTEVYALSALGPVVGLGQIIRERSRASVVGLLAGLAAPAFGFWYLNRYSEFNREDDTLSIGDAFPEVSLPTTSGEVFSRETFRGRRTLVMGYRGGWCPFCTTELLNLKRNYAAILDRDLQVVAVSVDDLAQTAAMQKRVGLDITFASDHSGALLNELGVEDDGGLVPGLAQAGFGGDDEVGKAIYLPTSFLVDEEGTIRWIYRAQNYRVRATVTEILAAADSVFGERAPV